MLIAASHEFIEFSNLSVTPFPIKRGDHFYIKAIAKISKICPHVQCNAKSYSEKKIQWGILNFNLVHQFKNYINITFVDVKYNLCDLCVLIIKTHCPLQPGIHHFHYNSTVIPIMWPVSLGG